MLVAFDSSQQNKTLQDMFVSFTIFVTYNVYCIVGKVSRFIDAS